MQLVTECHEQAATHMAGSNGEHRDSDALLAQQDLLMWCDQGSLVQPWLSYIRWQQGAPSEPQVSCASRWES